MWLGSLITHLFCFYLLHTLDLCSFLFIDFRDKEKMRERVRDRETQRGTSICCSTHLCIYWLILVYALTRDYTCNLGVFGQCSNQLLYPSRASSGFLIATPWVWDLPVHVSPPLTNHDVAFLYI